MKKNMEIIRDILLELEASTEVKPEIKNQDSELVRYNMALLIEAKLVDGTISKGLSLSQAPMGVWLHKLTWEGHEFLDNLREESVWNKIKDEFQDASLNTVTSVAKKLAEGYAKKKVEELLNEKP